MIPESLIHPGLLIAALIQFMIFIANFFAPAKLNYRVNLAKMEPFLRQVFIIHCIYIAGTVGAASLFCVIFPPEIIAGGRTANGVIWFLAVFWGTRVLIQFFYYDQSVKRRYPVYNVLFAGSFLYLGVFFTLLAIRTLL